MACISLYYGYVDIHDIRIYDVDNIAYIIHIYIYM